MSIFIPARRGPGALVRALTVAVAAVVVLAGCGGSTSGSGTPEGKSGAGSAAFPVTIEHGHGSTTIKQKPKRVVAISWMSLDVVAALGTVPVGVDEQWGGDKQGYTPWFRSTVEKLGGPLPETLNYGDAGEIDFEQILALEPDLIVGLYSGITDVDYKRLSQIAPTVPYLKKPWDGGTWQEMTRTIGTALGETEKAESLVTDVQGQLAAVTKDHPEFKGTTFAYGLALAPGSTDVGLYVDYDARVRLLTEMGFENTPSMEKIASTVKGTNWYGGISLEKLDTIDADIFVAWANGADEVEHTLKDPLFTRWKPIADRKYAFVQDPTMGMATSGPSVLSIPWAIDRYVPMLADAVAGRGNTGAGS
ncbi:iron-siderophore ABC transporter substrate-binding protein [Streptomyces sp. CB02115]|uniref:iron-siderophore ABC transporter substrate-binding protein n=1 Tax=Streptomyces sp. CB02115 TaxID=1703939 RepID=UPI00093F1BD7|nr:iron-siderophore ABC transporter substrate-binding protein [Streptomyces sp. CB02115]OKJ54084.1 Fe3+-hydroxamate ABC transporter substrate-binding protein [Streptomyces sp. CB02115]